MEYNERIKEKPISANAISNAIYFVNEFDFVRIAYKDSFGSYFIYDETHYKVFFPFKDAIPRRFRMDPIKSPYDGEEWLAYGRKYWNEGTSKNGLCFSSFKNNEDYQLVVEDSDDILKFQGNKLTRNHQSWFCYDYEYKRDPHKRSWKENTKKRHQYEVNM